MRHTLQEGKTKAGRAPKLAGLAIASCVAMLVLAPTALATSKYAPEFEPFADCPLQTAVTCTVANTTSGEFDIGNKDVPIEKTVTLQGGLASTTYDAQPLLAAADGDTLSKTPQTEPGGLLGIANLGGEVTATAELAGPASSVSLDRSNLVLDSGTAVTLPIKVHLENETLGGECYIGSDAEPIVLHLTDGTTSPPAGTEPIKGSKSVLTGGAKGKITKVEKVSLVDNTFAVPGATGCGGSLSPVIDEVLDLDVGLPSAAGSSKVVMNGNVEEALAENVEKYLPKPKKEKKKK